MPWMSLDTRKRVIILKEQGFSVLKIITRLQQERIFVSQSLYNYDVDIGATESSPECIHVATV